MTKKTLRLGLLLVFIVMVMIGIKEGEMAIVFDKAVRICLECIGIG